MGEKWDAEVIVTHSQWVAEIVECEEELAGERHAFARDALHPVQQIIEKLKGCKATREDAEAEQVTLPRSEEMMGEVYGMRRKLERVWCTLEGECVLLYSHLITARSSLADEGSREDSCTEEEREREKMSRPDDENRTGTEVVEIGEEEKQWSKIKAAVRPLPATVLSCSSQQLQESLAHEFSLLGMRLGTCSKHPPL